MLLDLRNLEFTMKPGPRIKPQVCAFLERIAL